MKINHKQLFCMIMVLSFLIFPYDAGALTYSATILSASFGIEESGVRVSIDEQRAVNFLELFSRLDTSDFRGAVFVKDIKRIGDREYFTSGNELVRRNIENRETTKVIDRHFDNDRTQKLSVSPDGTKIALSLWEIDPASGDVLSGEVWIYDTTTEETIEFFDDFKKPRAVTFSPDGTEVIVIDEVDGVSKVHILPLPGASPERSLLETTIIDLPVDHVSVGIGTTDQGPCDPYCIYIANDRVQQPEFSVYDRGSGDKVGGIPFRSPFEVVTGPDGTVYGSHVSGISAFDPNTFEVLYTIESTAFQTSGLTIAPDGKIGGFANTRSFTYTLFDPATGEVIRTFDVDHLDRPEHSTIGPAVYQMADAPGTQMTDWSIDHSAGDIMFGGFGIADSAMIDVGFSRLSVMAGMEPVFKTFVREGRTTANPWVAAGPFSADTMASVQLGTGEHTVVTWGVADENNLPAALPLAGATVTGGNNTGTDEFSGLTTDLQGDYPEVGDEVLFTADMVFQTLSEADIMWFRRPLYGTPAHASADNPWEKVCDGTLSCSIEFKLAGGWVIVAQGPGATPIIGATVYVAAVPIALN